MATFRQTAGAPIVMGLTPYTLRRSSGLENALGTQDWAPYIDADRLDRYAEFEALVENRPYDVFSDLKLKGDQKNKIVIALALPELVCNVWADSVWSDPPNLIFNNDDANERWQQFVRENDVEQAGWESVFSAAMRGTSIWKLHVDESEPIEQIRLDEVSAGIFFPTLKRGSDRVFSRVLLAWEEDRADADAKAPDYWQVREWHALNDRGNYTITTQERRKTSNGGGWNTVSEQTTALDFVPFVDLHGARWSGRYWGMSEIGRIESIIDEIDNRLSDIAEVLEYHGKPILQVPKALMRGGTLEVGADRAIGIQDEKLADVARYITYDGQIDSQIAALDKLLELAFLVCEVPRTYFGMGVEGAAVSGTSLKLQLQNYLKKAGRWQRRETTRLRALGEFVMRIAEMNQEVARDSRVEVGSPLPADDEQEARIENLLSGNAVLSSRKTSISKLRRVDDVDEELARIDEEQRGKVEGGGTTPPPPGLAAAGVTVGNEPAPQSPQAAPQPPVA